MSYRTRARAADPHWTTARFACKAACGTDVKKGDRIWFVPSTKTVLVGPAAEQAARNFDAAKFDEGVYTGTW
jgi:hypothetical protein